MSLGPVQRDSPEYRAKQLRIALEELGPRYSCLALYLSSRIDLLPAEYCRELAFTADAAPALPPSEIRRFIVDEFGDSFFRSFHSLDYQPHRSTLTRQSHTGRLTTGDLATVTFLRPEYHVLLKDHGSREFLDPEVIRQLGDEIAMHDAAGDFVHALRRKVDLSLEKEAIENAGQSGDQSGFDHAAERKVYYELSSARVLTVGGSEYRSLSQLLTSGQCSLNLLSQHVCKTWLKQAISGNPFPVDAQEHHVVFGSDNQLCFEGCELVKLPKSTTENLWNYLLAALVDDPDRSASYLLQEMQPAARKDVDLQSFRTNFRQAAYFAALEPILGTDSNALAQLIFQHWRTALDHGYSPKPWLLCFYRGLFSIARIARKISTDDSLREGMEDLRTEKVFDQFRELAGLRYWMQNADKFAGVLVNLPRTFDQALTRSSHPPQELVIQDASDSRPHNVAVLIAIFLLIAAVLIAELTHLNGYSVKIVTGVLMLAGILALRALAG